MVTSKSHWMGVIETHFWCLRRSIQTAATWAMIGWSISDEICDDARKWCMNFLIRSCISLGSDASWLSIPHNSWLTCKRQANCKLSQHCQSTFHSFCCIENDDNDYMIKALLAFKVIDFIADTWNSTSHKSDSGSIYYSYWVGRNFCRYPKSNDIN